ncbi:MAG TPA: carboxypeptidase regulatory-like domain-containing protein, partial [Propionibacteriaceae bacterium]|nr:carboxypeptidase regulatory-like domain-containing protein [Propionibacteriaceae bacterium]
MRHASYGWRAAACHVIALSIVALGLVVVAAPPAHAVADAVVSGTVVDSLTKQPLADVTVSDSASGRSTTTAVAGTYSLSVPPGDHVLTATLAGYVPSSTPTLTLTAGQILANQGFTLEKYASASGIVTEKGTTTGIAGVVVKLFDAATTDPNPEFAATTGPDGSWSIDHVAPGTYKVQFDGTGTAFLDRWYPGQAGRDTASTIEIAAGEAKSLSDALRRRPRIAGTIVDASFKPLTAATITANTTSGLTFTALTDAQGHYEIAGLVEGSYQVRVSHEGLAPMWLAAGTRDTFPIYLVAGDVYDGSMNLIPGCTISGVVHLPPGEAAIVVLNSGEQAVTRPDGSFSFPDVAPPSAATVYAVGYVPLTTYFTVSYGQTLNLEFAPVASEQPAVPIAGTITDTSGKPIAGATVSDWNRLVSATSGPDGAVSLYDLPSYNQLFRVTAPGYVPKTLVTAPTPTSLGTIVLQRSATISGTVVFDLGGSPLVGADIRVYGATGTLAAAARTDSDGAYRITDLEAGYYVLSATARVGSEDLVAYLGGAVSRSLASFVKVAEGAVLSGRDVTVQRTSTVSGVITQRGAPASGAPVGLVGMGASIPSVQARDDGSFTIAGIPPGTYRLRAGTSEEL